MDFLDQEDADGIRFTYNVFPANTAQAAEAVLPLAAVYKPMFEKDGLVEVATEPVVCRSVDCGAILNPYTMIDMASGTWTCRLCLCRNALPQPYPALAQVMSPAATTIEYTTQKVATAPPLYLFVVDTSHDAEDADDSFSSLKDALLSALAVLPPHAVVGLISYSSVVNVHEMALKCRQVCINGSREFSSGQLSEKLGFSVPRKVYQAGDSGKAIVQHTPAATAASQRTASRYLQSLSECEATLAHTIENLVQAPFDVNQGDRPLRATGAALNAAIALVRASYPNTNSRIMLFSAGPCTVGEGIIVKPGLKDRLRSHRDLVSSSSGHLDLHTKASKFYASLASQAVKIGAAVDIFGGCYDQIGLDEMSPLAEQTGGWVVQADSFTTAIFRQSLFRLLDLARGGMGTFDVKTNARELKIRGLLGAASSLGKKGPTVVEKSTNIMTGQLEAGTSSWRLCSLDAKSALTVVFETVNAPLAASGPGASNIPPSTVLQFVTHYLHPDGVYKVRVTTVSRAFLTASVTSTSLQFDQEAAAAVMARLALHKAPSSAKLIPMLDRWLVLMCTRFSAGAMTGGAFLPPDASLLPQFIFHLRRSPLVQIFNSSPDETAYYRHLLLRADTGDSCVMIQPALTAYEINKEPQPVLLDSLSLAPDRVLLLDTFHHILIYYGETIAAWHDAGYQDQEDYASFAQLLKLPQSEAVEIVQDRFPLPRYITTRAKGSQARFLLTKLNPSKGGAVLTDDVSLQDFMASLVKQCQPKS